MSETINHSVEEWKDVLARLRCAETSWRGHPLSCRDHETFTEAIVLCAMVLDDLSNRYPGLGDRASHVTWAKALVHVDVDTLSAFLPKAMMWLRALSCEGFTDSNGENVFSPAYGSFEDFKHPLVEAFGSVAELFFAPVVDAVELHLTTLSYDSFYPLYQFMCFMTHLTLSDLSMEDELEAAYESQELELEWRYYPDAFVAQLNNVMRGWFGDFH